MIIKKEIKHMDVKCFNIISDPNDKRFGQECGKLLFRKNSEGMAAGQIKCNRCKALYDIKDNEIIFIERK